MTPASCIYEGHLRHRRFFPVAHQFRYRVFFIYLDLESFIRPWEFYLCYCEGGFAERRIGDVQMVLAKPGYRESRRPLGADFGG